MMMMIIATTLLSFAHLTKAIPCAGFDLGTVPSGADIISDGVSRNDYQWDHDHLLSENGKRETTLYLSYPEDIGVGNYTYSVESLTPNEATCSPTVTRTCDTSKRTCELVVTFDCKRAGQSRILLSFTNIIRGKATTCQDVSAMWTKTHGSALIVGTSLDKLDNVVVDGVPTSLFDPSSSNLYSQDAYTSNITFYFSIQNGSLPYTMKQSFFHNIDISAVGQSGASLELRNSGSIFNAEATGLYSGAQPVNLTLSYGCKNFGWSTISIRIDMTPFAVTTFSFRKYCTHVTGFEVRGKWAQFDDLIVRDGEVSSTWSSSTPEILQPYTIPSTAFSISNTVQNTSFQVKLGVDSSISGSGACNPSFGSTDPCVNSAQPHTCWVYDSKTIDFNLNYNCDDGVNGYITLTVTFEFSEALSIEYTWRKYTGNRRGLNVEIDESFRFLDQYQSDKVIVSDGQVPLISKWLNYDITFAENIVRLPLRFTSTFEPIDLPKLKIDQPAGEHQQCLLHARPYNESVTTLTSDPFLVDVFMFCKNDVDDVELVFTLQDELYRQPIWKVKKSNANGWSRGVDFKVVDRKAYDLSSHDLDEDVVYVGNAPNAPRQNGNQDVWGGDSYDVNGDPLNDCKDDATGLFVGCSVVDTNEYDTRYFAFGMKDETRGCKVSDPIIYVNESDHCDVNATVNTNDMPSWVGDVGILSVQYNCDNKHNKIQSYMDIVMELPMQCDDVGNMQSMLIRWIKQSGAQLPDTPDSPNVISRSTDSVRLGLSVPKSHGNSVTSLILEISDSSSNNNITTRTIQSGNETWEDGEVVEYEIKRLDNSVHVRYAAVNVAGQSAFSQFVKASPDTNIFTWWVILCICVGGVVVIAAFTLYVRRNKRRGDDDDDDMPSYIPTPMERTPIFGESVSIVEDEAYVEMEEGDDDDEEAEVVVLDQRSHHTKQEASWGGLSVGEVEEEEVDDDIRKRLVDLKGDQ